MDAELGTFLGAGYVIRYVPAPGTESRGYDINVVRPVSDSFTDIVFLRTRAEVSGVRARQAVLVVGDRTEDALLQGFSLRMRRFSHHLEPIHLGAQVHEAGDRH